jgi:GNAT superfamily N-acetyltransferase
MTDIADGLKLVRVVPYSATYGEALRVGETFHQCYESRGINEVRYHPRYRYLMDLETCRRTIHDPAERLNEYIKHAKGYSRIVHYRAREFHLEMLDPTNVCYRLYREEDSEVVGYVSMSYPDGLDTGFKEESMVTGVWHSMYINWLKWKYWVIDRITDVISPWLKRLIKEATEQYYSTVPNNEELSKKSYEELEKANYPMDKYVYIRHVFLTPEYQGKGIAKRMLTYALNNIPDGQTGFHSSDSTAIGPLKISLLASDEGRGLYTKLGFKDQTVRYIDTTGGQISTRKMDRKAKLG